MTGKQQLVSGALLLLLHGGCVAAVRAQSSVAGNDSAPTQTPLPARLSDVEGSVQIVQLSSPMPAAAPATAPGQVPPPPADTIPTQALPNMPVLAGMEVDTGNDGRAELQFSDGSIARVTPNSAVAITSLSGRGEQVRAVRGLAYFEMPAQTTGVLSVQVGPDQAGLTPDSLLRVNLDKAPFEVAALRGSAFLHEEASGVGFVLPPGQTATLDPVSPTAYDVHQDLASDSWDAWNGDRDNALAEMASQETSARVGNGAPDAQAWNDLDYYGTWYNVPGEGMAWAPDGVDAGFDPYGAGSWGFYSGVGPTWISAYPWGWLPYRCGGWNYFNGFGWGWQPGTACSGFGALGWYPYAGVRHAPPIYRVPPVPHLPRRHFNGVPIVAFAAPANAVAYRFRTPNAARPPIRPFPLATGTEGGSEPAFASVLPAQSAYALRQRLPYANGLAGSGYHNDHILGGHYTGVPNRPAPYAPASAVPHAVAPPPVHYAPAPAAPAPHVAAPAPAPAPAAHGH